MYFDLNREGCIITYDKDKQTLTRRGYLYGFKSTIEIKDIQRVAKVYLYKQGNYYILIDNNHSKYDGIYKSSYFGFVCSKESKEFIEQFWNEPLEKFYD